MKLHHLLGYELKILLKKIKLQPERYKIQVTGTGDKNMDKTDKTLFIYGPTGAEVQTIFIPKRGNRIFTVGFISLN